jgi:hypothetical protein
MVSGTPPTRPTIRPAQLGHTRRGLRWPVDETVLTVKDTSLEGVDVVTDFGEGQALDVRDSSLREVGVFGLAQNTPDLHGIRASGTVTIEDTLVKGGYAEGLEVLGGLAGERQPATARSRSASACAGSAHCGPDSCGCW